MYILNVSFILKFYVEKNHQLWAAESIICRVQQYFYKQRKFAEQNVFWPEAIIFRVIFFLKVTKIPCDKLMYIWKPIKI